MLPTSRMGRRLLSDAWLSSERCIAWCGALLLLEVLGGLVVAAYASGLIPPSVGALPTDFVSFYAAGRLADAGTPALVYDRAALLAAEHVARGAGTTYLPFNYPPVFLLLCAALGRLPYAAALIAFEAVGFAALVPALRRILGLRGWRAKAWVQLVPFLAFPAVWINAVLGQNAFVTAALFAWGLLLLQARPLVAGLLLGTLCYKPHFGLLVPLALATGGHWRAIAGAALAVAFWVGLSLAAFGAGAWMAYLAALPAMPAEYQSGAITFAGMVTPLGAARVMGWSPAAGYAAQAGSALAAAAAVAWVWSRGTAPALCAATLLAGTLLCAPLLLLYDLVLAAVAIAFLSAHARATAWLAHEKLLLGVVVAVPLFTFSAAYAFAVPIGPLAGLVLLALCLAHAWRDRGGASRRQRSAAAAGA